MEKHFRITWKECRVAYKQAMGKDLTIRPSLWKRNGDDLIYSVCLNEPFDASCVLTAWLKALKAYRIELKKNNPNLDIKGSAWIAGFPIDNAEVIFEKELSSDLEQYSDADPKASHFYLLEKWHENPNDGGRENLIIDYVGPAIDTGFRITTLSSPRKFTLSLETALLLSYAGHQDNVSVLVKFCNAFNVSTDILKMAFEGLKTFKGVLGGKPYPLFWIDFLHDFDNLTKAYSKISPTNYPKNEYIFDYCNTFIADNSSHYFRPFIHGCKSDHFNEVPDNYKETLNRLTNKWDNEKERLETWFDSIGDFSSANGLQQTLENVDRDFARIWEILINKHRNKDDD